MRESALRDYLAGNMYLIDRRISLIETEHVFPGGRIDILARKGRKQIAIELKSRRYKTQHVCVQLMNYMNYTGEAWFVAPKVNRGVYSTLQGYGKRLSLYEIRPGLHIEKVGPQDLDDSRPFPRLTLPIQKADIGVLLLRIGLEWFRRST